MRKSQANDVYHENRRICIRGKTGFELPTQQETLWTHYQHSHPTPMLLNSKAISIIPRGLSLVTTHFSFFDASSGGVDGVMIDDDLIAAIKSGPGRR